MQEHEIHQEEFSFKNYFIPFTKTKAITWIVIIGFVVFSNALFSNFIGDDLPYILQNPQLRVISLTNIFGPNEFNNAGQYRPFTVLYYSVLYAFFGYYPFFYHLIQLTLHILCTLAIFIIFRKFMSNAISFFIALIFLVHTINVESVANIASSDSELLLVFGLLALFFSSKKILHSKDQLVIFCSLFISLLIKEAGILFFLIIPLYRYLFIRKDVKRIIIGLSIIFLLYLFVRIDIGHIYLSVRPLAPIDDLTLGGRLLNIPLILHYYLSSFVFPNNIATDQYWAIITISGKNFFYPLLYDCIFSFVFLLIGFYIYKINKRDMKAFIFFFIWFFVGITLYLQIVPLENTVADRWFYFPIIGLLGMIGLIVKNINKQFPTYNQITYLALLSFIIMLSLLTIGRNNLWSDPIKLYNHDSGISDNFDIEVLLDQAYFNRGDYKDALVHINKSIAMRPYEYNLYDKGAVYDNINNYKLALENYSLAMNADNYDMFYPHKHNILLYERFGIMQVFYSSDYSRTNLFIKNALRDYPKDPQLWQLLVFLNLKEGNTREATKFAQITYTLNPSQENKLIYQCLLSKKSFNINVTGKVFHFI